LAKMAGYSNILDYMGGSNEWFSSWEKKIEDNGNLYGDVDSIICFSDTLWTFIFPTIPY
jgi:hypothetical protein